MSTRRRNLELLTTTTILCDVHFLGKKRGSGAASSFTGYSPRPRYYQTACVEI